MVEDGVAQKFETLIVLAASAAVSEPPRSKSIASSPKELKVVNEPNTPTKRKVRVCTGHPARSPSPQSKPMARQPTKFTARVPQGNPPRKEAATHPASK